MHRITGWQFKKLCDEYQSSLMMGKLFLENRTVKVNTGGNFYTIL